VSYNLTAKQEELARELVALMQENKVNETFHVREGNSGILVNGRLAVITLKHSIGEIAALVDAKMLVQIPDKSGDLDCTFRDQIFKAVDSNFGEAQPIISPAGASSPPLSSPASDSRIVFVVHGRNEALRKSMFDFLRAIGLKPLEWSEAVAATGHASPYIGDILDAAFAKAQAVVVLMTPDDEASLKKEFQNEHDERYEKEPTGQARPNVLFEAGMAMGRDPKRTLLVEVGKLRPYSDVGGRHVVRLNDTSQRRQELATRLKTAGCEVDLVGTDWHTAGSFSVTPAQGSTPPESVEPLTTSASDFYAGSPDPVTGGTRRLVEGQDF
jgi:predicted nucleotide-binding protein